MHSLVGRCQPCLPFALPGQAIYPGQEMGHPSIGGDQSGRGAVVLERHLSGAFKRAGYAFRVGEEPVRLWVSKGTKRYPLVLRAAREARRGELQALLADAILRGRANSKGPFIAMVGAPAISPAMARALEEYVAEVAPAQPFGYVDERGLVRFQGLGLEGVRGEPPHRASQAPVQRRPRDPFSDLNQWLLKVLIGRALPPEMLSVPREAAGSAAALAALARVSTPAAWRLTSALKEGGHLDEAGNPALVGDLMPRWRAAARRPQQRVGARWVLPGRAPLERLRAALADLRKREERASACLGLFAACDALGVGNVRGVPAHLYVRHLEPELLERLGLVLVRGGQQPELLVQVARWPESVFRAAVSVDGVPVADVLQCWLDVSGEPARGAEQAAFLWRRVIGPAIAKGEPEP